MNALPNYRKAAALVGSTVSLGVFVAAVRMGVAAKQPIVGIVGGLIASGIAFSVGYNATRLVVDRYETAPALNPIGTPDPSTNAGAMN